MYKPQITNNPLYQLLREGKTEEFNRQHTQEEDFDLRDADLRGVDLRGLDARGLDLTNCYLRQADLRGIDFSKCCLEGASINGAKISGVLFPKELSAEEITLSLLHGTRIRYKNQPDSP